MKRTTKNIRRARKAKNRARRVKKFFNMQRNNTPRPVARGAQNA